MRAKKLKEKKAEKYQEGFIKGKKVFLIGILPVIIMFVIFGGIAWIVTNYYYEKPVNNDSGDAGICNTVRKQYPSSLGKDFPCEVTDSGDYWLVTFTQNTNANSVPAYMTFNVQKSNNAVTSAIDINNLNK